MRLIWKQFQELTLEELYAILRLREAVFIVEQNCPYPDCDNKDQKAIHGLGYRDNELVAYCRFFKVNDYMPNAVSIGRVVTTPHQRGQGLGKALMAEAMRYAEAHHHRETIHISAQCYLQHFYEGFGFQAKGEIYLEDNIPHISMKYIANPL